MRTPHRKVGLRPEPWEDLKGDGASSQPPAGTAEHAASASSRVQKCQVLGWHSLWALLQTGRPGASGLRACRMPGSVNLLCAWQTQGGTAWVETSLTISAQGPELLEAWGGGAEREGAMNWHVQSPGVVPFLPVHLN